MLIEKAHLWPRALAVRNAILSSKPITLQVRKKPSTAWARNAHAISIPAATASHPINADRQAATSDKIVAAIISFKLIATPSRRRRLTELAVHTEAKLTATLVPQCVT